MAHVREGYVQVPAHRGFPAENLRPRPVFESDDGNTYYAPSEGDSWRELPLALADKVDWHGPDGWTPTSGTGA